MKKFLSDILTHKHKAEEGAAPDFGYDRVDTVIGPDTVKKIKAICSSRKIPLDTYFLTVLVALLYRYTGEEEITVTLLDSREGTVMDFTGEADGERSFGAVLKAVGDSGQEAYRGPASKDRYYNILFAQDKENPGCHGLAFDLCVTWKENPDGIAIGCEFNGREIEKSDMERFSIHFVKAAESAAYAPETKLCELDLLSAEEEELLLKEFTAAAASFPSHKTVVDLFEEQVLRCPDKAAVRCGKEQVSYGQLNRRVNRLARYLKRNGVGKESCVVLLMERSIAMLESILAIWKAGGAYIPVDVAYPEERLRVILEESKSPVVVTLSEYTSQSLSKDTASRWIALDQVMDSINRESPENMDTEAGPENLAYVIFTSGSTGKPKGAMVEHIGMLNHMFAKINDMELSDTSIIANNASHCFDISVWQMFCALILGGTTIIYPNELVLNPDVFIDTVIADEVTVLEVVPSFLSAMLEQLVHKNRQFPRMKYLLVTGETLKPNLVRKWFEMFRGIKLVNAYGPTEASDDITHCIMEKDPERESIPIGRPVQNFKIYILDPWMKLCPVGIAGEICVAGIGVGRGYLNNPEKTKEAFMINPFGTEGERLYKTGDIGRWTAAGEIDFIGRKDFQVKVRGFRIELGEIETALEKHPFIHQSAVAVREDIPGNKYITAYFEGVPGNVPENGELRHFLAQSIPEYMIPSVFVPMERLPLNSNGKIDRRALPVPDFSSGGRETYIAPQTALQKEIAGIWENLFDFSPIGLDDDFLELGGHSLLATQLVFRLNAHFDISVPLREVLTKGRTVRGLTEIVEELLLGQVDVDEIQEMIRELEGLSEEEIRALLGEQA